MRFATTATVDYMWGCKPKNWGRYAQRFKKRLGSAFMSNTSQREGLETPAAFHKNAEGIEFTDHSQTVGHKFPVLFHNTRKANHFGVSFNSFRNNEMDEISLQVHRSPMN